MNWPGNYSVVNFLMVFFFFQDLLTTEKSEKRCQMADMEPSNYSAPNDTWTVESLDLYKKTKK